MRTTINIPDELVRDLVKKTGQKTRTAAVNHALSDWLRLKKIQDLRALRGKLDMADDWEKQRKLDKNREV